MLRLPFKQITPAKINETRSEMLNGQKPFKKKNAITDIYTIVKIKQYRVFCLHLQVHYFRKNKKKTERENERICVGEKATLRK